MVSKLRRLAADHAVLHEDLPPNYLFPSDDSGADDLTQLTTLLAGPQGTPYSQGLWRLHLKMPDDYPKSPPKATFKTRIWHPNVEESTGAVCVDTLKRDWKSTLTLKDVLITISCLLIYPNPDSALNSTAGALLQENYGAFSRQAKLMTSIHAPIPSDLKIVVAEAKMRGEESGTIIPEQEDSRCLRSRKGTRIQSLTMKKKPSRKEGYNNRGSSRSILQACDDDDLRYQSEDQLHDTENMPLVASDDENEHFASASKENDPSLSPSPVKLAPPSSRKNAHGKRPLSVLTMTMEPDPFAMETDDIDSDGMTASERNIAANCPTDPPERDPSPQRKSPKLSILNRSTNASGRIRDDIRIYQDIPENPSLHRHLSGDGKENRGSSLNHGLKEPDLLIQKHHPNHHLSTNNPSSTSISSRSKLSKPTSGLRKVSLLNPKKTKPRIGIRRL